MALQELETMEDLPPLEDCSQQLVSVRRRRQGSLHGYCPYIPTEHPRDVIPSVKEEEEQRQQEWTRMQHESQRQRETAKPVASDLRF